MHSISLQLPLAHCHLLLTTDIWLQTRNPRRKWIFCVGPLTAAQYEHCFVFLLRCFSDQGVNCSLAGRCAFAFTSVYARWLHARFAL